MAAQFVNAMVLGAIYLLFSMGLTLSWGVLNILNMAHGSIFMFGAFSAYWVGSRVEIGLVPLFVLAVLVGGVLSTLLHVLVYRPLQRRAEDEHEGELAVLIASIAASAIPVAIALNVADAEVVSVPNTGFGATRFVLGPIRISVVQIVILVLAVLLAVGVTYWISRTQSGRALRTIAVAPRTASLLGIPAERLSALTMFLSGAMAGGAGLLLAVNASALDAHIGDSLLLKAFAVIILGGVGSIRGAAVGAFLLAFAETATVAYVASSLRDPLAFIMIFGVLLVRPEGLVAKVAWRRA